jgi:predicted small integral membrane protein
MDDDTEQPVVERHGFLPIETNAFDRVFIAILAFVAINLLWMRFLESVLPLNIAIILSLILGAIIIARG